jgi:hypothetical protein
MTARSASIGELVCAAGFVLALLEIELVTVCALLLSLEKRINAAPAKSFSPAHGTPEFSRLKFQPVADRVPPSRLQSQAGLRRPVIQAGRDRSRLASSSNASGCKDSG